ncbi:hypothetical protein GCM10010222_13710 [Streptomyces tanashiensis]|uniref:hypothetical protein n=1 Tax=Streptomyces tanashiensis TaxID=67367 RepID=UPI0019BE913B|nr:hypothetical protein [Streptomyces tanashiensis]GGS73980.1 hypothetical protein GCM10010222_13710 [Streptomyces tanashiensis]
MGQRATTKASIGRFARSGRGRLRGWLRQVGRAHAEEAGDAGLRGGGVVDAGLDHYEWKDEDEYAHVRRLGIITDTEHRAVDAAREETLGMLASRTGVFADADRWATWRWNEAWPTPYLPGSAEAAEGAASTSV